MLDFTGQVVLITGAGSPKESDARLPIRLDGRVRR